MTVFRDWFDKTKKSSSAEEMMPEMLRATSYVLSYVQEDDFFCKAMELRYCEPIPNTRICACNLVVALLQHDGIDVICDRRIVSQIRTQSWDWECPTVLKDSKCGFSKLVPCDNRLMLSESIAHTDNFTPQSGGFAKSQHENLEDDVTKLAVAVEKLVTCLESLCPGMFQSVQLYSRPQCDDDFGDDDSILSECSTEFGFGNAGDRLDRMLGKVTKLEAEIEDAVAHWDDICPGTLESARLSGQIDQCIDELTADYHE